MLDGGSGRFLWDAQRAQVIRMEAVIGDDQNVVSGPASSSRRASSIPGSGNRLRPLLIKLELVLRHGSNLRRMKVHEGVAEMIDAGVKYRQEIPRLVFQYPGGRVVDGGRFREIFASAHQPPVLFLIHLRGPRDERKQHSGVTLAGMHPQLASFPPCFPAARCRLAAARARPAALWRR